MAETLTVDPNAPAEIVGREAGVELTADEQDSLAVGEQIVEQQEQLLAGKYKDAEALEKAYINLQKKLGEDGAEKKEDTQAEAENESEEVLQEESEESSAESSPATELITSASEEYEKDGKLTPETLEKFNSMSSQDLVKAYMDLQASGRIESATEDGIDITNSQVNEVKNYVGGEKTYQDIVNWAGQNLEQDAIKAFDNIVGTGDVSAIKLAISGLKSQYENANGYEGRMVTGKAPTQEPKDVFRSQAELVRAMGDKRYDNYPAYRQDVIEKLERSDNLQF